MDYLKEEVKGSQGSERIFGDKSGSSEKIMLWYNSSFRHISNALKEA